MNIRALLASLTGAAAAATVALPLFAVDAMAAKEKFQRTKPHVNVGTIGNVDQEPGGQTNAGGNGTTSLQSNDPSDQDCEPAPSKAAGQSTTSC
jgi:hypothetical protein